ncbi:hypothetical protein DFH07DRAFT_764574 [Mycena maculata]|uniref:Uncharacterized protein n=1 Tax=Mycena maculata TaxID=230809 RepID=A0AAD7KBS1_9AGAR|nr:hypothetical protein DFH07DRAFT_764574 [Mycena maculata]
MPKHVTFDIPTMIPPIEREQLQSRQTVPFCQKISKWLYKLARRNCDNTVITPPSTQDSLLAATEQISVPSTTPMSSPSPSLDNDNHMRLSTFEGAEAIAASIEGRLTTCTLRHEILRYQLPESERVQVHAMEGLDDDALSLILEPYSEPHTASTSVDQPLISVMPSTHTKKTHHSSQSVTATCDEDEVLRSRFSMDNLWDIIYPDPKFLHNQVIWRAAHREVLYATPPPSTGFTKFLERLFIRRHDRNVPALPVRDDRVPRVEIQVNKDSFGLSLFEVTSALMGVISPGATLACHRSLSGDWVFITVRRWQMGYAYSWFACAATHQQTLIRVNKKYIQDYTEDISVHRWCPSPCNVRKR